MRFYYRCEVGYSQRYPRVQTELSYEEGWGASDEGEGWPKEGKRVMDQRQPVAKWLSYIGKRRWGKKGNPVPERKRFRVGVGRECWVDAEVLNETLVSLEAESYHLVCIYHIIFTHLTNDIFQIH